LSRPAAVYLVMLVVLIAGLWSVLAIGRHLTAPEDLAGKWQLTPVSAASPAQILTVEQSGRFFQIAFEHGPQLDLKQQGDSPLLLANREWRLTITGQSDGDDKTMQLDGPQSARWTAHRIVRTFPSDVQPKEVR